MIRQMTAADLPNIMPIEKACFTDAWTEEMFLGSLDLPIISALVFEEDGEIQGYLLGSILLDEGEIANVATAPKHRKKGVAKKLMDAFEEKAKTQGVETMFLEVRVSNLPAQSLYSAYGYEKIATRKKYYPDGEDAFVMKKTF